MVVLSVDTSSPRGTMALAELVQDKIQILSEGSWQRDKSHSELITVTCEDLLNSANRSLRDVRGVIVGVGPGSFTGVRVGINFARSLCFAANLPIWSASSLRLWASQSPGSVVVVISQAFRDLVYFAVYQRIKNGPAQALVHPQAALIKDLPTLIPPGPFDLCGDGWSGLLDQWPETLQSRIEFRSSGPLEAKAFFSIKVEDQLSPISWKDVKPLYIRGSEAEEKLRLGLLKPVSRMS